MLDSVKNQGEARGVDLRALSLRGQLAWSSEMKEPWDYSAVLSLAPSRCDLVRQLIRGSGTMGSK